MTVVDRHCQKVLLGRPGRDPFWNVIQKHYAHEDARVWRSLAMFALKESLGLTVDQIALAFGLHRGHVSRCIHATHRELRARFDFIPDVPSGFSDPDEPGDGPESFAELWELEMSNDQIRMSKADSAASRNPL
jgi:hypothetical protein